MRDRFLPSTARGFSAIGLVRPKSPHNEGGVYRAAHCFGAGLVLIQGARFKHQASNVTHAHKHVPVMHVEDMAKQVPHGCQKVAIEFVDRATDLRDFTHPERALYIFGPEDGTLGGELLDKCQHVLRIPTAFCLNLAATVNVVLYDRLLKRGCVSDRLAA